LDGGTHDLTLAHRVVAVAEGKQRARHVDAQENGIARADLGAVHVPAEVPGDDRRSHLATRWRNAEAAEEGRERYFPGVRTGARGRPGDVALHIDVVAPGRLREVRSQHRRLVVADECSET